MNQGTLMTPAKVYVVNEPLRYDPADGWVKKLNLRPARAYGELVHLLPAGELPSDMTPIVLRLREGLASFSPADYLLLTGDPRAIALAGALAARSSGGPIQLLHWDRENRCYDVVRADLSEGALV